MAEMAPILIAGGGIGGLALAIALARRGRSSKILERRPAFSEAGAGIQIGPNGHRVLSALGVAERLGPVVAEPRAIRVHDGASGQCLSELPLGGWLRERHGAPYWLVHRRDLQAVLLDTARANPLIQLLPGTGVVDFRDADDAIEARTGNGVAIEGAALVIADGLHSTLRQRIDATALLSFARRTAARAVVADSEAFAAEVHCPVDCTGVWLAPKAHAVHYPVRGGSETAVVVVREEEWNGDDWSAAAERDDVIAAMRQAFSPRLANGLVLAGDWRRWALFTLPEMRRWSSGRVTLLGDAAHPTLPFLAQGGCLALEDALTLARSIDAGARDLPKAFSAYEAERKPRTTAVVKAAEQNGRIYHLGGLAAAARNSVLRLRSPERIMAGYDWIYGWHPASA